MSGRYEGMADDNQESPSAEIVEVLEDEHAPGALWTPVAGTETLELLEHLGLPPSGSQQLQEEAVAVLSRCVPPSTPMGSTAGLVIGYIQSGKTMSFTTVTALARDNGYKLIIVITGVNK